MRKMRTYTIIMTARLFSVRPLSFSSLLGLGWPPAVTLGRDPLLVTALRLILAAETAIVATALSERVFCESMISFSILVSDS